MIQIRKGGPEDIPAAFNLVKELAIFEKAPEQVITSEKIYTEDAFGGENPWFEFLWLRTKAPALLVFRFFTLVIPPGKDVCFTWMIWSSTKLIAAKALAKCYSTAW